MPTESVFGGHFVFEENKNVKPRLKENYLLTFIAEMVIITVLKK